MEMLYVDWTNAHLLSHLYNNLVPTKARQIIPISLQVSIDCFNPDKDAVLQRLRDTAIQDLCCGQNAVIERTAFLMPKSEVTVYAIVTNIVQYIKSSNVLADSLSNGNVKRQRESVNGTGTSRKRSKVHRRKSRY